VADDPVPGMRTMRVNVMGAHLGELGTPATLRDHLGRTRAADVAQAAAKILIWMEEPGRDAFGDGQQELIEALFPPDVAAGLLRLRAEGGDRGGFDVMFHPGQLLALQKLAPSAAQAGSPTSFDGGRVGDFVLAAGQIGDVRDSRTPVGVDDMDEIDTAIHAFRASELDKVIYPMTAAGRAHQLWLGSTVPWPSTVEHPDEFCRRTFGVSLRRFVAIAAAPALGRLSIDLSDPGSVPFNPRAYFSKTNIDGATASRVLGSLTYIPPSAGCEELPETYWCFFDLAARPLVPCGSDIIVPCSLRYSLERSTTGIFWMLHSATPGAAGELTTHFGRMFEQYCLAAAVPLTSPTLTVRGELEYGPARSRRKTCDVLITAAPPNGSRARVFVECRAGRPPRPVFAEGSRDAFKGYLRDITEKLRQLDRVIRDHVAGAFTIPDDLAGGHDAYLPLLVVDTPFHWTFLLKNILDQAIARDGLFQDPRVSKPIVCSIDEYESLLHACERGADLATTLRAYLADDRMDPLEHFVYKQAGPLRPPTFTEDGWESFKTLVIEELFR
jgi:hypothetical protein